MFELDSGRLDMVREDVVYPVPLFSEVKCLERLQAADFVEPDYAALVKSYKQLAT